MILKASPAFEFIKINYFFVLLRIPITGRGKKSSVVAVTTGLLNILDTEELEGVIAHELTHIRNRDALVLTLASLFSTVAWYLMQFGFYGGLYGGSGYGYGNDRDRNGGGLMLIILLVAMLTWVISFLIISQVSHSAPLFLNFV
jgi:heat shock protein HtpX